MAMIEVEDLTHYFPGSLEPAVDGVSFEVERGKIFGLLGPNGAGKSTIINILTTFLQAGAGLVKINGYDAKVKPAWIREMIGVIFQDSTLDERLTAYENLYFHAKLYHVPTRELKSRIQKALEWVNLAERQHEIIMRYSGGMKRRLEIARGILHQPEVLFLDEPTIGLDPQTRKQIWDFVLGMREKNGLTTFLTTHYLEEAEICNQVAIIDHGKVIAMDTPANLKQSIGGAVITLRSENTAAVCRIIQESFKVEVSFEDDELRVLAPNDAAFLPRLFDKLNGKISAVDVKKTSLEDVFIRLTGREICAGASASPQRLKEVVRSRRLR
ncbi:MAG TPA: ATP-binding cassette domain-containing protein [Bacillota bacterium]|nr:ATP-binding cassette domain-containing protein [Bacillota bacterium]